MTRLLLLCGVLAFTGLAPPAHAQDAAQNAPPCAWCVFDAIYGNIRLIDHEEANPDLDEAIKGPDIIAARAEVHRLRKLLGPLVQWGTEPCCYSRKPLVIR